MPFSLHVGIVVVLTAYFIYRFIKEHHIYEFLFILWIPSTMLRYVSSDPMFLRVLGISQCLFFILVIFFMFKRRNAARRRTAEILASYSTGDLDKAMPTMQSVIKQKEELEGAPDKAPDAESSANSINE